MQIDISVVFQEGLGLLLQSGIYLLRPGSFHLAAHLGDISLRVVGKAQTQKLIKKRCLFVNQESKVKGLYLLAVFFLAEF